MALEQITFNIGAFNDANAGGNNYYAGMVFEVKNQSDNTFATIYADASGSATIPQNGIDNVSNSIGECNFYIDSGDYYIEVDSNIKNFTAGISKLSFDNIDEIKAFGNLSRLIGETITTNEYHAGTGYGGASYEVVNAGSVTPNDMDIIQGVADSGAAVVLRYSEWISVTALGMKKKSTDSSPYINRAGELLENLALVSSSNLGLPEVTIDGGDYVCLNTLNIRPWFTFKSLGQVNLDFTSATGTALNINNESNPFGNDKNAASNGKVFSGRFSVKGAGTGIAGTVGVEWGNSVSTDSASNFRDAILGDIVVQEFETPLIIRGYDTYINTFLDSRFELGKDSVVYLPDASGVNSGERMTFRGVTIAGATNGVTVNDLGSELFFDGCSFDFCPERALQVTDNAGFQTINFNMTHFENVNDECVIEGPSSDRVLHVSVSNSSILPKNSARGAPLTRADRLSVPRTALFKGYMTLTINGLSINGYNKDLNTAESGLFMCDESVYVSDAKGITFTGVTQSISRQFIANENWRFEDSTVGASLEDGNDSGYWCIARNNGIDSIIDDSVGFDGSTKSLRLDSTFALSESFELYTSPCPVNGNKIGTNTIIKAPNTSGDLTVRITPIFYKRGRRRKGGVTSISRNITNATITTDSDHNLKEGSFITISGVEQSEWNRDYVVRSVPTSNTLIVSVPTSYTGTPTTLSSINFEMVNDLEPMDPSQSRVFDFGVGYDDTTDPSYQSDRDYFARFRYPHNLLVPAGAVAVSLRVAFDQIDVGESLYVGGVYVENLY